MEVKVVNRKYLLELLRLFNVAHDTEDIEVHLRKIEKSNSFYALEISIRELKEKYPECIKLLKLRVEHIL